MTYVEREHDGGAELAPVYRWSDMRLEELHGPRREASSIRYSSLAHYYESLGEEPVSQRFALLKATCRSNEADRVVVGYQRFMKLVAEPFV